MNATTAQFTTDLQAVFLWQQNIQNDQVIGRQFSEILPLLPIIGSIDAIPFVGQVHLQRLAETMVIFYHQNTHREGFLRSFYAQRAHISSTEIILCSFFFSDYRISI